MVSSGNGAVRFDHFALTCPPSEIVAQDSITRSLADALMALRPIASAAGLRTPKYSRTATLGNPHDHATPNPQRDGHLRNCGGRIRNLQPPPMVRAKNPTNPTKTGAPTSQARLLCAIAPAISPLVDPAITSDRTNKSKLTDGSAFSIFATRD